MKLLLLTLLIPIAAVLTSCNESSASPRHDDAAAPENGAQFKDGKGVSLTALMIKSIGLQTAEVQEEKIAPSFTITLQAVQRGTEANGWLTGAQAARVQPGMEVGFGSAKGSVLRVEKAPYVTLGDFEVTVQTAAPVEAGSALSATFRFPAGDAVTAIPKAALLTTAEGTFVYAKNDEFYLRTPVKVGAASGEHVEITDGLYTGDEIVTTPVMSLWLAELQILRGGKACTCGH
jgi:multidrug efflux pump subunit AcrA (membrane-fusion protein)